MARVLIPDAIDLAPTAALRGLGRRGHICDVAWSYEGVRTRLGGRYCNSFIPVPSLHDDPDGFAQAIVELCSTGKYDVLLPTRASSLGALLPHRNRLGRLTGLLMPTDDQFHIGMDKDRTINMCRDLGVLHPETALLVRGSPIEEVAAKLGYPLVAKHRRNFGASIGVRVVANESELGAAVQALLRHTGKIEDLMFQRFLPGPLYDACLVARSGELAGLVTQARTLMYPISGGVGCILVTVDIPQLTEQATQLVRDLNWTGACQIEFKWDPDAREFSLIEINPRFWATTGAWLRAGVNFPALAVELAMGRDPEPFVPIAPNLRFKYMVGRTPLALCQLWRAKGLQALRDPVRYARTWYDFDIADPLPDLARAYDEIRSALQGQRALIDESLPATLIPSLETPVAARSCTVK